MYIPSDTRRGAPSSYAQSILPRPENNACYTSRRMMYAVLQSERAEQQKEAWLQLPVGRISGTPGLFPLIHDMPASRMLQTKRLG